MNKIYPSDLIKLIQKQLDSDRAEITTILVTGLNESFEEISLKLNLTKQAYFQKNAANKDYIRLESNTNYSVIIVVKFDDIGTNYETPSQKIFEIDYAKDEIVSKMKDTFK